MAENYFRDSIRIPFLSVLVKNIKKQFQNKSILAACYIFNYQKLPIRTELLADYGNTDIEKFAYQYQAVVASAEEGQEEWSGYQQFLREITHLTKNREVIQDLCSNASPASLFQNISQFAKICRVIPVHTADVGRAFLQLKLIKTQTRNKTKERTLDSITRIAVEGPGLENFAVAEAVEIWASPKNRPLFT